VKLKKFAECINDGTPDGHWLFASGYGPPDRASWNRGWWFGFFAANVLQIVLVMCWALFRICGVIE
jgi:hypothetical protein